jgi:DNA-binding LytR/AlgR family response regulator
MEHFVKETSFLTLVKSCNSAVEAVNILSGEHNIQLIFLDIEMPVMNGMDLMKSFANHPEIILMTSHKNYALEAFEYNVTDYLLKPVTYARYLKAVKKAAEKYKENINTSAAPGNEDIYVKVDSSLIKLTTKDILWLEAMGDYVSINTADKKYMVYSTMKHMEEKLPESFMRVHRSYIVNLNKISNIDDHVITINKNVLSVSRNYKDALLHRLNLV